MDVIDDMTREEQIRVKEEAQRLLRSIDLSHLTVHTGEARLEIYPPESHGSGRKRTTKKKAEFRTVHDGIGLASQMSTAKGGRPKIEIRAVADISAFALVTVDDGDSVYYTARTLSKAKPVDIKLDEVETSISIHVVDPNEFITQLQKAIADSRAITGTTDGVNSLMIPGQASLFVHVQELFRRTLTPNLLATGSLLLACIGSIYRHVKFLNELREMGAEEILCKKCYAKNVFSFFEQSFFYLFMVTSILGHVYVAARILLTWSCDRYPRFAVLDTTRIMYNFLSSIYYYYTLPHAWRMALTPGLFKQQAFMHSHNTMLVLLLLWNPKRNVGHKGLLHNAFGAAAIGIVMTSTYFYCASALHAKLIPGVDFHSYMDIERGFIEATEGLYDRLEDAMRRDPPEHTDL